MTMVVALGVTNSNRSASVIVFQTSSIWFRLTALLKAGSGAGNARLFGRVTIRSRSRLLFSLTCFSGDLNETEFPCFFRHCCCRFAVNSWFGFGDRGAWAGEDDCFAYGGGGWRAVAIFDRGERAGGDFIARVCGDFTDVEAAYAGAGGAVYGDRAGFSGDRGFGGSCGRHGYEDSGDTDSCACAEAGR